jgi:hypothetical protein
MTTIVPVVTMKIPIPVVVIIMILRSTTFPRLLLGLDRVRDGGGFGSSRRCD